MTGKRWGRCGGAAGVVVCASAMGQPCQIQWQQNFGLPGYTNGQVRALVGVGPDVYVGGEFDVVYTFIPGIGYDPTFANAVARWDGIEWHALGAGTNGGIHALAQWSGFLYAGGSFSQAGVGSASRVARYEFATQNWTGLGPGVNGPVYALHVHDDGAGPRLYVGGAFFMAGGQYAASIAAWNGQTWSPLGSAVSNGLNAPVHCVTTFDDGSGEALYVGGAFTISAGGAAAHRIARWRNGQWSPLASGVPGQALAITAMAAFDAGAGTGLWVGGDVGATAQTVSIWKGGLWEQELVGGGPSGLVVRSMAVFDDGMFSGPSLYVGLVSNASTKDLVRRRSPVSWGGVDLENPGHSAMGVSALHAYDNGSGPALYAGAVYATWPGPAVLKLNGCPPLPPCYPDCSDDGLLTVADFGCFQTKFVAGEPYADCTGDGPLTVADFGCFQTKFVSGCP